MPWWTLGLGRKPPAVSRETTRLLEEKSLTASASTVSAPDRSFLPSSQSWQNEVWSYYDTLGEFRYAVDWKARMMSRVRFYAAEIIPGQDEPSRLGDPTSLPSQLVSSLGGASKQASLIDDLSTQLDIPGEGYVIAETVNGVEVWTVRSKDEIRKRSGVFEITSEDTLDQSEEWRPLAPDHLVMRVFRPHKRHHSFADSASRAARGTMRELELVNRHIISQYLSRLASAGIVIFPEEISFPVREEFADQPDPFMAEWIEIAARAIQEPGTASAVVPIPMRVPGEWVGQIQHLDFTLQLDAQILDKRESSLRRLATQLNIPAEILTGMGDVNHWGAWQLEEGALKTFIAPDAEMICDAFTSQYLQPRLAASGEENPGRYVVWYDMSELTLRPDRSANAVLAYDRQELSGEALRREGGFDESDKPTTEELREQLLKLMSRTAPDLAPTAYESLTGDTLSTPLPAEGNAPAPETPAPEPETRTEPDTRDAGPPSPEVAARIRSDRLIAQAQAPHAVRFGGSGRGEVLHPFLCEQNAYSCPYTQAALKLRTSPGRSGLYECTLDAFGSLRVGEMTPQLDTAHLFPTRSTYAVRP